jgi:hypothetical protein
VGKESLEVAEVLGSWLLPNGCRVLTNDSMARRTSAIASYVAEANRQVPLTGEDAATDVEYLANLGFDRGAVNRAMSATRGDRKAALVILRGGGGDAGAWRGELKDDFTSGLGAASLPIIAENRAVWKTPYYVRVGETRTRNETTYYVCTVVKKNGETWKIEKRFSQFLLLKNSFPFWSTHSFSNPFPPKKDLIALFGGVNTETRRQQLEEWVRELCLNEECMRNETILGLLGAFVEESKHQPPLSASSTGSVSPPSISPMSPAQNPRYVTASSKTPQGPLLGSDPSPPALTVAWTSSPPLPLPLLSGPLNYVQLKSALPFRIAVPPDLIAASISSSSSLAAEEKQLNKDYSRDRLILQSHVRLEGSSMSISQIVATMKELVANLLGQQNKQPLSNSLDDMFFLSVLKRMGRTESAFITFGSFSRLLESGPDEEASVSTPFDTQPIMIIPESSLAEPIKIFFSLKNREGTGEWCLQADCEAGTSFRVNDAESDDINTLLQVKITYQAVFFGMPVFAAERGSVGPVVTAFSIKEGKRSLVAERDMRATARDWNQNEL